MGIEITLGAFFVVLWKRMEWDGEREVIKKAKEACANCQYKVEDHFVDMHEMIEIGKGAKRSLESVKLSRYAFLRSCEIVF